MKRRKRRIMAILLAFAMVFTMVDPSIFGGVITVQAEESPKSGFVSEDPTDGKDYYTYNILSEGDLLAVSSACNAGSGYERYLSANYVLYDNLDLTDDVYHNKINIGSSSRHFTGTFDGQGHSITGLSGDAQTAVNNGLFGVMEGATVKNLVIKNANYRSNQYGGILAAQAENSVIQNVTIIDSSCKVASLGAVVGLITTGGLYGGALVGYAGNTKIYNCESRNTSVYVDTTGGVQALGGDGMYMGGLVGWMDNGSILEYSRVVGGTVSTEYYVAVGALAANNLYAGGLVGRIDGSDTVTTQVLDCFSSASVNYAGECYVSVGAGLSGYAGGIAARISGSNYKMERCHYAGNIHGHLLNSILVFPVIAMEDYYLGGVAGNVADPSNIRYCYFNWENAIDGNKYPSGPKMPAISGESNTGDVTTIGEAQYSNPTFFDTFDFAGTTGRVTGNAAPFNGEHKNKWVIDPVNNMPVHGKRVEATMDFPGAGTITFAKTSICDATSTSTNESNISQIAQVYEGRNEALTLTATVKEGYNFKGWYKNGALVAGTEESTLTLGGDDGLPYEDNDVYEAKYTADVVFKGITADKDISKEYTYNQHLDELIPEDPVLNGYVFLGWSADSTKNFLNESSDYYRDELTSTMIDDSWFINEETPITGSLTLYPVFIMISKYRIKVQMESYELYGGTEDNSSHIYGQEGQAKVLTDENGRLYITVEENSEITEENGYRFDGWYENDECVSTSKTFYNVDLSKEHTYEARYQYRVTAYIPVKVNDTYMCYGVAGGKIGEYYIGYNKGISSIPEPSFRPGYATFKGWVTKDDIRWQQNYLVNSFGTPGINSIQIPSDPIIVTKPIIICAVPTIESSSVGVYYPISIRSDFPNGVSNPSVGDNDIISFKLEDGYNLLKLSQYDRKNFSDNWSQKDILLEETDWNDGTVSKQIDSEGRSETILVIQLTANINFYNYDGTKLDNDPVTRTYNSKLFNTSSSGETIAPTTPTTPDYITPGTNPVGSGTTPTNESMYRNGYKFIGWTTDEGIFTDKENYVVSSEAAVSGSLLNIEETRVTETMDVYPVYLKYDITFKTNFDESASAPKGELVEVVDDTEDKVDGAVKFKFTGDGYEFAPPSEWTVKIDGIEATDIDIELNNGIYTITGLETETEYEIIASCTATVTFNDGDSVEKKQYDYNQELGKLPTPTQEINDQETSIGVDGSFEENVKVFVGWNSDGSSEYVEEQDKVTSPMNLTPVYVDPNLNLKSDLADANVTITVSTTGKVALEASKKDGYEFAGWEWTDGTDSKTITVEKNSEGKYVYELTPEEVREGGTYTAKFNPIITYKIPKVESNGFSEGETVIGSIPYNSIMGKVIDSTIMEVTTKTVEALKGTDYVFEGKWSKDSWTGEEYTDPITEPTTLYPIITTRTAEQVTIYSNIDDSNAIVTMSRKDGKVTLPETLPETITSTGPKGVSGETVNAEFVGYSLVFIVKNEDGTEISRVSDALYAPGDTIDADEITVYTGEEDERHQIARVYAVWAQIQTIPEGSMYFGGGTPSFDNGLFSAVAVNTKILIKAGLQTGNECSYDRSMTYTLGKNTPIVTTAPRNIWDNDLYKSYFDNSFESDTWDIYTSVLYNLSKSLYSKKINISPALEFTYKNQETKSITGETVAYSHTEIASKLLKSLEEGEKGYTWENHKDELAQYAGYTSYEDYQNQ